MIKTSEIAVKTADKATIVLNDVPFLNESHKMRFETLLGRIHSKDLLLHGVGMVAAAYVWASDDPWKDGMGEEGDASARSIPYDFHAASPLRVRITDELLDNYALDLCESGGGYIEDAGKLSIGNLRRHLSSDDLFLVGVAAGIAANVYSINILPSE